MAVFRPSLASSLATAFVVLVTVRLGFWQLSRYEERSAIASARVERHALHPLDRLPEDPSEADFRRVRLEGRWVGGAIATGGIPWSRNGYAAFGALDTDAGRVLVLRGWVPADRHAEFLEVEGPAVIEGVLRPAEDAGDSSPTPHPASGRPVWTLERETFLGAFTRGVRLPVRSIARQLGANGELYVVAGPELEDLEARSDRVLPAGGYTTYLKVFHHLEYAVQWFAFGAIAAGLWAFYGVRRARLGAGGALGGTARTG